MRASILVGPFTTGCIFLVFLMSIRRWRWGRKNETAIAYGLLLLFFPAGVFSVAGAVRLLDWIDTAEFHYAQASEMNGSWSHIPPSARNIDIYRNGSGYVARFSVSTEELTVWVHSIPANHPELDLNRSADDGKVGPNASDLFEMDFGTKGFPTVEWKYEPDMRRYQVALAANGAGFKVWNAPDSQIAYLRAFYY